MKSTTLKKLLIFSLVIFVFSGYSTCVENQEKELLGCWKNSREESKDPSVSTVFRPCDFMEFPPSRFRFSFELMKAGECRIAMVGATDAHYMENGTWTFDKKTRLLELFNAEGNSHRVFEIINFGENLLELKPR
ncbi:MAG: hypothetical protein AAF489_16935 [Bacteroidota bacterium]